MSTKDDQRRMSTDDLRAAIARHAGRPVARLRRKPFPYASSVPLELLDVVWKDGRRSRLVWKDVDAPRSAGHAVRPAFVASPRREVEVYRRILGRIPVGGVPSVIAALTPFADGRYGLLYEYVEGVPLWQVAGGPAWREAARWLARLHATATPAARRAARTSDLLRCDAGYFQAWLRRARRLAADSAWPVERRADWLRLVRAYPELVRRLAAEPAVFLHGECYASNVLVRTGTSRNRICVIDWDMAGLGPAALDLAALTAGSWPERERMDMLRAYRTAWLRHTGNAPALAALRQSVRLASVHLAVQMIGWAEGWKPPREHAQDWLDVALRHATELGML